MRTLLTSLAALALIFFIGCGGDDKTGDGDSDGCGPATNVDDNTPSEPPAKTDGATPPAKTDGDAAKTATYKCAACGKTESAAAAPS